MYDTDGGFPHSSSFSFLFISSPFEYLIKPIISHLSRIMINLKPFVRSLQPFDQSLEPYMNDIKVSSILFHQKLHIYVECFGLEVIIPVINA